MVVVGVLRTCAFRRVRGCSLILLYLVEFIFAWSACVGQDVDTSMFLRTVASPETLNG
jgi:hypothetical protein